jgi:hypothetical protein
MDMTQNKNIALAYPEFEGFINAVKKFAIASWELANLLTSIEAKSDIQNRQFKEIAEADLSKDESSKIIELNTELIKWAKEAKNMLEAYKLKMCQNQGNAWFSSNDSLRRNISTLNSAVQMACNNIEEIRCIENRKSGDALTNRSYDDILLAVYEFVLLIEYPITNLIYAQPENSENNTIIKQDYDELSFWVKNKLSDAQKPSIDKSVLFYKKLIEAEALLLEMSDFRKKISGLNVNLKLDSTGIYKAVDNWKRVNVQNNYEDKMSDQEFFCIKIPSLEIVGTVKINQKDVNEVLEFIKLNMEDLLNMADEEVDIDDFKKRFKKPS